MRLHTGFISNSSSTSFIVALDYKETEWHQAIANAWEKFPQLDDDEAMERDDFILNCHKFLQSVHDHGITYIDDNPFGENVVDICLGMMKTKGIILTTLTGSPEDGKIINVLSNGGKDKLKTILGIPQVIYIDPPYSKDSPAFTAQDHAKLSKLARETKPSGKPTP